MTGPLRMRRSRRLTRWAVWAGITVVSGLGLPGVAGAVEGGLANGTLSSSRPGAPTSVTVTVAPTVGGGIFSGELGIIFPLGDTTAGLRSVSALCSAVGVAATCPASSIVGSGTVSLVAPLGRSIAAPLTLALGDPTVPGDIASIDVTANVHRQALTAMARLLHAPREGPELLITDIAQLAPKGFSVSALTVSLGATRISYQRTRIWIVRGRGRHRRRKRVFRKHRIVNALLRNPGICTGVWAGEVDATIGGSSNQGALTFPCQMAPE